MRCRGSHFNVVFFFYETATAEIYTYLHTLSLHDALPIVLVADLGAAGTQVGDGRSLVVSGDLESAAGAGGGLLEDQRDRPTAEPWHLGAGVLGGLEVGREPEEVLPLLGGEVELLQEAAVAQVEHDCSSQMPARSIGQVMQRGPPRPRPSS